MEDKVDFRLLEKEAIPEIIVLGKQLNPKLSLKELEDFQKKMFEFSTYNCFGLFLNDKLVGISSAWITIRYYSGKQLEVDNVVVDEHYQSQGYGKVFFDYIEEWAKQNECKTIELNSYVDNPRSHKFYFNLGYKILGFHFLKEL